METTISGGRRKGKGRRREHPTAAGADPCDAMLTSGAAGTIIRSRPSIGEQRNIRYSMAANKARGGA